MRSTVVFIRRRVAPARRHASSGAPAALEGKTPFPKFDFVRTVGDVNRDWHGMVSMSVAVER